LRGLRFPTGYTPLSSLQFCASLIRPCPSSPILPTGVPQRGFTVHCRSDRFLPPHCSRAIAGRSRSPVRQVAVAVEPDAASGHGEQSEPENDEHARPKRNKAGRDRRRRRQAARRYEAARAANQENAPSSGTGLPSSPALRATPQAAPRAGPASATNKHNATTAELSTSGSAAAKQQGW
jgi:hypothetical protein